ncbi:MAG: metallophosphoesterase family protein [Solirubrobacteraceae bacterium]
MAEMLAGSALLATGCGTAGRIRPAGDGSTLRATWGDRTGTGILAPTRGEPLRARTELGSRAPQTAVLATLAHLTDAHVLDAQSPARVTFLDRLGPPFQSTFRPHETLTAQVLAGALTAIHALAPDAVIQGGDLIDNDQANELRLALVVLEGGRVSPVSGGAGYVGVQSAANADPFYYRPDLDAPRHPGLLGASRRWFISPGVRGPWLPVLGDHDVLVAGEIAPTAQTRALAVGDQAVWDLPPGLTAPRGLIGGSAADRSAGGAGFSPDGPPDPGLVDHFLAQALRAPKVRVPADRARRELAPAEAVSALRAASGRSATGPWLDYSFDLGAHVRAIVLDLARRGGGSGGLVHAGQVDWLARELAGGGQRWILVISHQPLIGSQGGDRILGLLDQHPRVVAAISGHIHRNAIAARPSPAGGYWLVSTASLIDYPQQARAMRLLATAGGGVAIQTWMLDHVLPGPLGPISRELAYLDAQGGRPQGFAGARLDRNVTLYRAAARA